MAKDNEAFSQDGRKIAEKALGQVRTVYDTMTEASGKTLDALQSALPADAQDFNKKVFSYAQNNINDMFDLAQKLILAASPEEVVKLQTQYLADQSQNLQKQATDLTTTIQKSISKGVATGGKSGNTGSF